HPDLEIKTMAELEPVQLADCRVLKLYGYDDLLDCPRGIEQQMLAAGHLERVDYQSIINVPPLQAAGKRVFLDLGSQRGKGLEEFKEKLAIDDSWQVHCFEPNPAYASLPPKVDGIPKLTYWPVAVWIENGEMPFKRGGHAPEQGIDGWGSTLILESDVPTVDTVIVETIDLIAWLHDNTSASDHVYIKMDIEGAEYAVLRKLLADQRADCLLDRIQLIAVEFHDRLLPSENQESTEHLINELRALTQLRIQP
ncbi:MAG: FkbM family methyltransferase, partial [Akkermansiaceae bacterium]